MLTHRLLLNNDFQFLSGSIFLNDRDVGAAGNRSSIVVGQVPKDGAVRSGGEGFNPAAIHGENANGGVLRQSVEGDAGGTQPGPEGRGIGPGGVHGVWGQGEVLFTGGCGDDARAVLGEGPEGVFLPRG